MKLLGIEITKKTMALLLVAIILVSIIGVIASIREPDVTITRIDDIDYQRNGLQLAYIAFDVTVMVDNPNIIGAELKALELDIFLNEDDIGDSYTEESFTIRAMGESEIVVRVELNGPIPIPASLSYRLKVKGTATVGVWPFEFDVPVEKQVTRSMF